MQLDDQLGWKHTPKATKIFGNEFGERIEVIQNEYGHRGPARTLQKEPDRFRILVLGDSFTEGVQVGEDDLFTAVLERVDPRFEVLNAGVGGYGTVQEYLYLESEGLKHNPDLVLLMVFDNDLSDNCLPAYPGFGPRPHAVLKGDTVEIVRSPDRRPFLKYAMPTPFAAELNKYSYLFYFLNTNVYQRLRANRMRELQKADLRQTDECGRYEVMFGLLEKMQRLLVQRSARFAVVLIPTREQVRQGRSPSLQPIVEFCARRGIACLSLLERFVREVDRVQPYFPTDIHWTKEGHRLAAEEIAHFLRGLSPRSAGEHGGDARRGATQGAAHGPS
jgi:lysophospholipase L1-like esterase